MKAKLVFLAALISIIVGLLLTRAPKKEVLNLTPPAGYNVAKAVEKPTDDTFVSALEYAQAFAKPEQVTETLVLPPKVVAKAKKATPKRQIARSKNKKLQSRKGNILARR